MTTKIGEILSEMEADGWDKDKISRISKHFWTTLTKECTSFDLLYQKIPGLGRIRIVNSEKMIREHLLKLIGRIKYIRKKEYAGGFMSKEEYLAMETKKVTNLLKLRNSVKKRKLYKKQRKHEAILAQTVL